MVLRMSVVVQEMEGYDCLSMYVISILSRDGQYAGLVRRRGWRERTWLVVNGPANRIPT